MSTNDKSGASTAADPAGLPNVDDAVVNLNLGPKFGLIGRKVGMSRLFTDDGTSVPVTIIDVSNNRVVQVRSIAVDGYTAVQLTSGPVVKASRLNKADTGHFAASGVPAGASIVEFPLANDKAGIYSPGDVINPDTLFTVGQKVDVSGVSLGKGFMGTIKRHNFSSNRASHGNSKSHNVPGSISMAQDPGRVFPGKKMSGHQGAVKKTVQNLAVVRIDASRGLIWVRGGVPGHVNGSLVVRPAVKGA